MIKTLSLLFVLCFGSFLYTQPIDIDLNNKDTIPLSLYTDIQFPSCSLGAPQLDNFKGDLKGISKENSNSADVRILKKQGKKIRKFHKDLLALKKKEKHKKVLELSGEAIKFINKSIIFKTSVLTSFDDHSLPRFNQNGFPLDFLSSQHLSTLSIIKIAMESSKALEDPIQAIQWSKVGLKVSRWIFSNRGCSQFLNRFLESEEDKRIRNDFSNVCHFNHLSESLFAEYLVKDLINNEQYEDAINYASLSITDLQITPESQMQYKLAVYLRLNNLARLAYSARKESNWCLVKEGFRRANKLAKEIDLKPLEVWTTYENEAASYHKKESNQKWTPQYGMYGQKRIGSYIPIKQVPPIYPRRLLERGIEGCAMMKFTVNQEGKTENIEVEWSTNPAFNEPSIESTKKYEYSPPMIAGVPSSVDGVRTVIIYKLVAPGRNNDYTPPGCS